jgi:putative toxin-antitoxin system antitoxin component (TIGR02293 family)
VLPFAAHSRRLFNKEGTELQRSSLCFFSTTLVQMLLLTVAPIVAIIGDRMVNELRAVVNELGGRRALGRSLSSDRDMREAIREGFPPAVVEELMRASGLTLKELANALDLSPRSLQRRRRSGRLARYESDRLYRLARIVAIANDYLGDHERALRWLKHPNRALGGVAPIEAVDTELGARQVENILGRVAYGGIS